MARSTCNPNVAIPKGMMKFQVIRTTVRDSLGQYCVPGDMAVLTKRDAQSYLDRNVIKVALPDDFGGAYEGDTTDEEPEGEAERPEAKAPTRSSRSKRATRASADSEGGEPSGGTVSSEAPESSGATAE